MNSTTANHVGTRQKILHEVKQFVFISLYLTIFFSLFKFYTRLVLAEYQVDYLTYGYGLLQSLALAKLILTGEALRLGERYRERPLETLLHFANRALVREWGVRTGESI